MPVSRRDLARAVRTFMEHEELKLALVESGTVGVISGVGALLGGLLGGPAGIVAGATVGAMLATSAATEFKPIDKIMDELSDEQLNKMRTEVKKVFGDLDYLDYATLSHLMGAPRLKDILQRSLMTFFRGLGYQILVN